MHAEYLMSSKNENFSAAVSLQFFGAAHAELKLNAGTSECPFNRYQLKYTSDSPLRGKFYYKNHNGDTVFEEFYLEAAKSEAVFSSFTDGYLASEKALFPEKIELFNTGSRLCHAAISSFSTEDSEVLAENIVYIENEFLKAGAMLSFGGGLSYIKYKKGAPDGIENLLNYYDTGRLVQQSYYGTAEAPYNRATYNGCKWSYNPVQGGDQYNNKSKLIDYKIGKESMYVKCRPLDWAQKGLNTMSYMENTYSLNGKCLRVDNRFIDFSPYRHALHSHQELPAFYTLSAFGKFTYYNGLAPWTYDELISERDLKFWGGNPDAYFHINPGNTETWCAFTDDKEETGDFGIGLYVPNISLYIAGRYMYNGSTEPSNHATNYVAPLRSMGLKNFVPIEYSYLITAGKLADIRRTFTENAGTIDNSLLETY